MSFSDSVVQQVWEKGSVVQKYDSSKWRQDACGAWIGRAQYGDHESTVGWDIDHKTPVADGGSDQLQNLQPLHWKNNVAKADGPLQCVVRSQGNKNAGVS